MKNMLALAFIGCSLVLASCGGSKKEAPKAEPAVTITDTTPVEPVAEATEATPTVPASKEVR